MPLLGDRHHAELTSFLKDITRQLDEPSAILVISAHWEEDQPTLTYGSEPGLIYDYYGFPPEAYDINYPALSATRRPRCSIFAKPWR